MAVEDYRRQGYSDRWINERMRSIEMRKELAKEGGDVARNARQTMERRLGRSVISSEHASDYLIPAEETEAKELPAND